MKHRWSPLVTMATIAGAYYVIFLALYAMGVYITTRSDFYDHVSTPYTATIALTLLYWLSYPANLAAGSSRHPMFIAVLIQTILVGFISTEIIFRIRTKERPTKP
jgi:hypothetical protein